MCIEQLSLTIHEPCLEKVIFMCSPQSVKECVGAPDWCDKLMDTCLWIVIRGELKQHCGNFNFSQCLSHVLKKTWCNVWVNISYEKSIKNHILIGKSYPVRVLEIE